MAKNKFDIGMQTSGHHLPGPGDTCLYICTKCGHSFSAQIPKPSFLPRFFSVKCPKCGGKAKKDPTVQY